jgi:chemotaxis response regulator CheB
MHFAPTGEAGMLHVFCKKTYQLERRHAWQRAQSGAPGRENFTGSCRNCMHELTPPPEGRARFPIGGIRASAGGLEATAALPQALSVEPGIAPVLIQHLNLHHVMCSSSGRRVSKNLRAPGKMANR